MEDRFGLIGVAGGPIDPFPGAPFADEVIPFVAPFAGVLFIEQSEEGASSGSKVDTVESTDSMDTLEKLRFFRGCGTGTAASALRPFSDEC